MSYEKLAKALLRGKMYFGPALNALQGAPIRHAYLDALVGQIDRAAGLRVRLLEIGSWAGGSAITLCAALKRRGLDGVVTCVDAWQPYDLRGEQPPIYKDMSDAARDGDAYKLFRHNVAAAGLSDMVETRVGYSGDVLPSLDRGSFDLVFVDGSHKYRDVLSDIRLAAPLLRDRGIMCGDDLELQADQLDPQELEKAVASEIDYVLDQPNNVGYHPGVTKAVWEAIGHVSFWAGLWAMRRAGSEWTEIVLPNDQDLKIPAHLQESAE